MQKLLKFFLFGCTIVSCANLNNKKNSSPDLRPNIVFIMSDDHGYQAINAIHKMTIDIYSKKLK
jgi:hypothetical protein